MTGFTRADAMAETDAELDRQAGWKWCREATVEELRCEAIRHGLPPMPAARATRHQLAQFVMDATT